MTRRLRAVPPFLLLVLLALLGLGAAIAVSANPSEGTVSLKDKRAGWEGKKFPQTRGLVERLTCSSADCTDTYKLNVDIDPANWKDNRGGVEVGIAWEDKGDDFDLVVTDKNGDEVASAANGDTTSERVFINEANRDKAPYTVEVQAFSVKKDASYGGGALVIDRARVASGGGGGAAGAVPTKPVSDVPCVDGKAGVFPCSNVDLAGFLPIPSMNDNPTVDVSPEQGTFLNDIWGWTDPETKREYALVGKTNGTAFVDVTDASKPLYLGSLPSAQSAGPVTASTIFKSWRDIKVYKDHAYIVSEEPTHGMQVFDLTRLRGKTKPETYSATAQYDEFGNGHNMVINEDSGFGYAVGTNTCEGGLHMVDLRDPKAPKPAGCVGEDQYVHDAQCVNYTGPDTRFTGREICFNSNEDTLTIVDVTDKKAPKQLSRTNYALARYTHQGWLTPDGRYFIFNDELDEQETQQPTTTRIFDVGRLDNVGELKGEYVAKVDSIDHNLYTVGDRVYAANYRSGLRVLDSTRVADGQLSEVGFFDVFPQDDAAEFNGSWSNYPYFKSGTVIVSGIEQGLFVLKPRRVAAVPDTATDAADNGSGGGTNGGGSGGANGGGGGTSGGPGVTPGATAPAPAPGTGTAPVACAASAGFRSVKAVRRGRRGATLAFETTKTSAPVTVDVFQTSRGTRVVKERLVARFTDRTSSVRWNGKANRRGRKVTDGTYFVRYRVDTANGTETRRIVLRRTKGRFSREPDFYRRATCDLLPSYKLERPVFGGRNRRSLGVAYKLARAGRVTVTVLRGQRVVKRLSSRQVGAGTTYRLRLSSRGLGRGEYRVRLSARAAGGETVTSTLTARKL